MPEEQPLYSSISRSIAVPGFGSFCKRLVGRQIDDLKVRSDGTGVYLRAGNCSVDIVYKPNSVNMIRFREPALSIFPHGRESQVHEYMTTEMLLETDVASERLDVLGDILASLYEGEECKQAFLEPRRALITNFITQTIPEDTPFFSPSTIPLRTDHDDALLFMEEANFMGVVCEENGKRTFYTPAEADR